jgi:hypothetical protein
VHVLLIRRNACLKSLLAFAISMARVTNLLGNVLAGTVHVIDKEDRVEMQDATGGLTKFFTY